MINPSTPRKFILFIIGGLFISEMISMGIISLIPSVSYFQLTILDSTLLYYFSLPLLLVGQLKGSISIDSVIGAGTKLTVKMPYE